MFNRFARRALGLAVASLFLLSRGRTGGLWGCAVLVLAGCAQPVPLQLVSAPAPNVTVGGRVEFVVAPEQAPARPVVWVVRGTPPWLTVTKDPDRLTAGGVTPAGSEGVYHLEVAGCDRGDELCPPVSIDWRVTPVETGVWRRLVGDKDNCHAGDPGDGETDRWWPPDSQQVGSNWPAVHDYRVPLGHGIPPGDILEVLLHIDTSGLVCVPDRCGVLGTNSPLFCPDTIEVLGSRRWDVCGPASGTTCQTSGQNLEAGETVLWSPLNELDQKVWSQNEVVIRVDAGKLNALRVNYVEVIITYLKRQK